MNASLKRVQEMAAQARGAASASLHVGILAAAALALSACGSRDVPGEATVAAVRAPTEGPTGVRFRPAPGQAHVAIDGQAMACSTCHSQGAKREAPVAEAPVAGASFHAHVELGHGSLTCLSCHNHDDYDTLRLADGRSLPFSEVRTLCAQCHGSQATDFERGVHGGMSGYWDTTRGEQVRNQCTHCHAPHKPGFPRMQPTFKPRDRFLAPKKAASDE